METFRPLSRRTFLGKSSQGLGTVAFASLLESRLRAAPGGVLGQPPLPQRAKRVIWLTMAGGPSHLETFDPKPKLAGMHGMPMPDSFTRGQQLAQLQGQKLMCFGPQHPFARFGKSQIEICAIFPQIGSVIDDICLIRSMTTDAINHDPAHMFMNTGSQIAGRPSMGAWVTYGLGTEAEDLPGFVVLTSLGKGGQNQPIAARQWSSGFLPTKYQGVQLRSKGDPVLYLTNPPGISRERQGDDVTAINALNHRRESLAGDPEIATRIAQYEMAFAMQASVPDLMDLSGEKGATLELYGCQPGDGSFASNCLLARRLAERGVRFIELIDTGSRPYWDSHGEMKEHADLAYNVDQPTAALITDLKQRGMLDETIILWATEFGRTPWREGKNGRGHHRDCFSVWVAGGGFKPGHVHGRTDDIGKYTEENPVEVHDLHATLLHQLGMDHERLTHRHAGRDFRLTDVHGHVVRDLLV